MFQAERLALCLDFFPRNLQSAYETEESPLKVNSNKPILVREYYRDCKKTFHVLPGLFDRHRTKVHSDNLSFCRSRFLPESCPHRFFVILLGNLVRVCRCLYMKGGMK